MSDPSTVVIKAKATIHSGGSQDGNNSNDSPPTPLNRNSSHNTGNGGSPSIKRSSSRFSKRSSRRDESNLESITLQESSAKSHPVTLKASFLRRKIKEYEGKENFGLKHTAIQL
jgi:hypothetical protein